MSLHSAHDLFRVVSVDGADYCPRTWKSKKFENLCVSLVRHHGFLPDVAQNSSSFRNGNFFSKTNDRFNAFDLIAIRVGYKDLYVQCTTWAGRAARRKKIEEIVPFIDFDTKDVEIWTPATKKEGRKTRVFISRTKILKGGGWFNIPVLVVADDHTWETAA